MALDLTAMKAQAVLLMADFGETLTVKSSTVAYSASGEATESWGTGTAYAGTWQAAKGNAIREEAGLQIAIDYVAFLPTTATVAEGNRIYRTDGSWARVVAVDRFPEHLEVQLSKVTGEPD